ncbi:MAG TPA: spore cortex-lytic protein [Firmicutes bacterium]|jgi:N-acetylmuramoyl-L-alanine amidase|nr:spore cortex-lytic protein [Bacillota bacterium]
MHKPEPLGRFLGVALAVLVVAAFARAEGGWRGAAVPQAASALSQAALSPQVGYPTYDDLWLLARLVSGEAHSEPYVGQVAVASVVLNRVQSPRFPPSVPGVIFEPDAFESVSNGIMWSLPPTDENMAAAQAALDGWDPTYGALYFWNPAKAVSPWIWTRNVITSIGRHVFGR